MPGESHFISLKKLLRFLKREQPPLWIYHPFTGYIGALLFVAALVFLVHIDTYLQDVPVLAGAPFGLISILVAILWGTGPALFALVLGLLVMMLIVSPGAITDNWLIDIAIIAPFVILQVISILAVFWLDRSRRALITAHQELQTAHTLLLSNNSQLERANAQKEYVLIRAAHELKTPLTTILGRTQLLLARLRKAHTTTVNKALIENNVEIINTRARYLQMLIESLFELSTVRDEDISSQLLPCDLVTLCRRVVEDQQRLSGRAIDLNLPDQSIIIAADEKRITQVISHLVTNAILYSPAETTIHVSAYGSQHSATFQINNDYPQLTSEQVEHLFDPLYRTWDVENSAIKGWGLGLTICKEILQRHGGHIWAQSSKDNQITFFVKLPSCCSITESSHSLVASPASQQTQQTPKID